MIKHTIEQHKYYLPEHKKDNFTCPHCGNYASQNYYEIDKNLKEDSLKVIAKSVCLLCHRIAIWLDTKLIYPRLVINVEDPNQDLPENIKQIYKEAAEVLSISPRASAILLRLALEQLLKIQSKQLHKKIKGDRLVDYIDFLIKEGKLDIKIKETCDILRIIGNNSAHPGKISIEENKKIVPGLFKLINTISEYMITRTKNIEELLKILPETLKYQIERKYNPKRIISNQN